MQQDEWSRWYGKEISETEYKELFSNLDGFFVLLRKWDKRSQKTNQDEGGKQNGQGNSTTTGKSARGGKRPSKRKEQ